MQRVGARALGVAGPRGLVLFRPSTVRNAPPRGEKCGERHESVPGRLGHENWSLECLLSHVKTGHLISKAYLFHLYPPPASPTYSPCNLFRILYSYVWIYNISCAYIYVYIYRDICIYICIYVCVYIYMYTCVHRPLNEYLSYSLGEREFQREFLSLLDEIKI